MLERIIEEIKNVLIDEGLDFDPESIRADTQLIGDGVVDSMSLVNLCLRLEDIAEEQGFEFDWVSEDAMSKSKSMFRTVERLTEEFLYQKEKN